MNTNRYRKILACCLLGGILLAQTSCKEGLDYENVNTIVPEAVWKDPAMINAFFIDIQGGLNPGWRYDGESSDEGAHSAKSMGSYLRGMITVDNCNVSLDYSYIDKINFFLTNLANVTSDVMAEDEKALLAAQAKFWRAWTYWGMVQNVGGVPLILEPQDATNKESLYHERNKTSECVDQILKDLDDAISVLPGRYADEAKDYGRITKVTANAFKGRVLLWYASPLFNPDHKNERWEAAYQVNKETVELALKEGYGLYPDFKQIWKDERNNEVIMSNQYFYPGHAMGGFSFPLGSVSNQPILSLLMSFPLKDGSYLSVDPERLRSDSGYNQDFMAKFYTDRDDRFYTSVYCGGTPYPRKEMVAGQTEDMTFWHAWRWNDQGQKYDMLITDYGFVGDPGFTGFAQLKGGDQSLTYSMRENGQTDWIEIRFAEVLMNMGECANELGKSNEALDVLYQIRKRAGIDAGVNAQYGITANSTDEIRDAYIRERQVEFAYESKRFGDLRRWKRFDILNNQGARHGMYLVLKPNAPLPDKYETIMDPEIRKNFQMVYIDNLDGDPTYYFDLDLNHWFYALNPNQISQSMNKLEQNNEWGGNFNPLQ